MPISTLTEKKFELLSNFVVHKAPCKLQPPHFWAWSPTPAPLTNQCRWHHHLSGGQYQQANTQSNPIQTALEDARLLWIWSFLSLPLNLKRGWSWWYIQNKSPSNQWVFLCDWRTPLSCCRLSLFSGLTLLILKATENEKVILFSHSEKSNSLF